MENDDILSDDFHQKKKLPYGESPALGLDWCLWHSDGIRQS